jgi:hypothetical protein
MRMRSERRQPAVALPVRRRRTIAAGGRLSTVTTVHCPRREESVTVAECLLCAEGDGAYTMPDGHFVACAADAPGKQPTRSRCRAGATHPQRTARR